MFLNGEGFDVLRVVDECYQICLYAESYPNIFLASGKLLGLYSFRFKQLVSSSLNTIETWKLGILRETKE